MLSTSDGENLMRLRELAAQGVEAVREWRSLPKLADDFMRDRESLHRPI